jgi:hypothetical protein
MGYNLWPNVNRVEQIKEFDMPPLRCRECESVLPMTDGIGLCSECAFSELRKKVGKLMLALVEADAVIESIVELSNESSAECMHRHWAERYSGELREARAHVG